MLSLLTETRDGEYTLMKCRDSGSLEWPAAGSETDSGFLHGAGSGRFQYPGQMEEISVKFYLCLLSLKNIDRQVI